MRKHLDQRRQADMEEIKRKQKAKSQDIVDKQNMNAELNRAEKDKQIRDERAAKLEVERQKRLNKNKKAGSVASTSWAIEGKYSVSGLPLLVVEPHTPPEDPVQYKIS